MPKITVTGATGQLGNLIIQALLRRGVPASDIRASTRSVSKAAALQEMGVETRYGNFDDPDSLRSAFEGSERVLIMSMVNVGARVEQHRRAVQAAQAVGASHIFYTSVVDLQQGEATSPIAADHRATERIIRETGIPYTFLRNSFYAEYMLAPVVQALDSGVFVSSVGDGKLGAAARYDMAEAAAVTLSQAGHENQTYELTYPRPWDYHEAVQVVSRVSGRPLKYRPVGDEEMTRHLLQAGMPDEAIQMTVGMNRSLRQGDLSKTTSDLERLLGRPVITLEEMARWMMEG